MLKTALLWVLYFISKFILSFRYRLKVEGLENIKVKKGILFLPSHPAEIDPILIYLVLWPRFKTRGLVVEHFFYLKFGYTLMRLLDSISIPDMSGTVNKWKQKKIDQIFTYVKERLEAGENFLIYPAGRLRYSALEVIGGASFVPNMIKESPNLNIVLVRTTGLWGSRFSRAFANTNPDFFGVVKHGLKIALKNGLFFIPRRTVTVEIEEVRSDFPRGGSRMEINQYLEKWFNLRGPEPVSLVSDYFWKKEFPQVEKTEEIPESVEKVKISPEIEQEVYAKLAELSSQPLTKMNRNTHLAKDLGLDSLDVAQLHAFLDQKYDLENISPAEIERVEDVFYFIVTKKSKKGEDVAEEKGLEKGWKVQQGRPGPIAPLGETIQASFLQTCDRMGQFAASRDLMMGEKSYKELKLIALLLARKIRKLEGNHIGILLPSSTTTYLLVLAILLAKKVPVMLNWTAGVRSLDHAVKITDLRVVFSSRKFLNNLNVADIGKAEELLLILEEFRAEISLKDKICAYLDHLRTAGTLLKKYGLDSVKKEDPAVVLFTSGTESLPKGVPLTHENLLENQKAALSCVTFKADEVLYSVLPPFHSFGFSVTGLFPLLVGIRVYYSPDPTDSRAIARGIERSSSTIFCCAPTFIKAVFKVAKVEQLASLRYLVAGAERTPPELFAYVEKLGKDKSGIEGYGITECAPMVTLTRPGEKRKGVGKPLPGVELCIIDPETHAVLPQGKEGEICIRGPNVFKGYIGEVKRSPFIEIDGKKWYHSGDQGFLDEEGNLTISGRLKRFVKIGAEMVSLGGLEEELLRLAQEKKWPLSPSAEGPTLALISLEKEEKPLLFVFTLYDVSVDEVNQALRECGYGRIVKIAEVCKIEQIPLMGTGKTHYRALEESLQR